MCGIVGCIGFNKPRDYIINGLKLLEYRGYDSAGIAFINHGIQIIKDKGSVDHLDSLVPNAISTNIAIGHTRWATHGAPNSVNSHPHISFHKKISLVHNGVIENFVEIKNDLLKNGYQFYGTTDSEIVANLLEFFYLESLDMEKALSMLMLNLKGSYALAIMNEDDPEKLYVAKNASPLLIGVGKGYNLVSSDYGTMCSYTNKFIELEDEEFGVLSNESIKVYSKDRKEIHKKPLTKNSDEVSISLNGYPHYMLKEIEEIDSVLNRLINTYYKYNEYQFSSKLLKDIRKADSIIFIGCGTSYHSSLVGGRYFEHHNKTTASYFASEWAFHPSFIGKKPFVILMSQSGETADVIHCQKIINQRGIHNLVITNTEGSTLARKATYSLLLHAGKEISVASTKAYVAQVAVLGMLAYALGDNNLIINDLYKSINLIEEIKTSYKSKVEKFAEKIKDKTSIFYLGRGFDYLLCLESSLKLKEISYINCSAFAGGEIKHGPIALIEKGTVVITFLTDPDTSASMRGNIEEVKARGAEVFVISRGALSRDTDDIKLEDYPSYLSPIVGSTIAFYLAYYVSLKKGLNVDKPRNLAKSVTVE